MGAVAVLSGGTSIVDNGLYALVFDALALVSAKVVIILAWFAKDAIKCDHPVDCICNILLREHIVEYLLPTKKFLYFAMFENHNILLGFIVNCIGSHEAHALRLLCA